MSRSIESLLSDVLRKKESAAIICISKALASTVTESFPSEANGIRFAGDDGM